MHPTTRCVDLFCGAGGFSTGAASGGMTTVLGVDHWDNALQVFKHNHHGAEVWLEELGTTPPDAFASRLNAHMRGRDYHLHGSPPCQAVSRYNTKARQDNKHNDMTAATMTLWFLDVVRSAQPASWSMEQVNSPVIRNALDRIQAPYVCVDFSTAFGLPQSRRRIIAGPHWLVAAVSASRAQPRFPADVLTGDLALPHGALIQSALNNTPLRAAAPGMPKHRPVRPGEWAKHADSEPAPTVTKCPHRIVFAGAFIGKLTTRQAMALQGFPDTYTLRRADNGKAAAYAHLLVGNAVPPPVGRAIARIALSELHGGDAVLDDEDRVIVGEGAHVQSGCLLAGELPDEVGVGGEGVDAALGQL